jgi:hypothetical protein
MNHFMQPLPWWLWVRIKNESPAEVFPVNVGGLLVVAAATVGLITG